MDMVYIVHYTPLRDRLRAMLKVVDRMGVGTARIITAYDREELTDDDKTCFYQEDLQDVPLVPGVVSVNIKHMVAYWDMIQNNYQTALVLEDDALDKDQGGAAWNDTFETCMDNVPSDFDAVFVSGCHQESPCTKGMLHVCALSPPSYHANPCNVT